jgi:hypothetical protein
MVDSRSNPFHTMDNFERHSLTKIDWHRECSSKGQCLCIRICKFGRLHKFGSIFDGLGIGCQWLRKSWIESNQRTVHLHQVLLYPIQGRGNTLGTNWDGLGNYRKRMYLQCKSSSQDFRFPDSRSNWLMIVGDNFLH